MLTNQWLVMVEIGVSYGQILDLILHAYMAQQVNINTESGILSNSIINTSMG
jgi:hypothetical protein